MGRGEKVDKDREKLSPFGKRHHGKGEDGDDGLPSRVPAFSVD